MGEVVQFVSSTERERTRLIREARAIYESIFPSGDPVLRQQSDRTQISHAVNGADAYRGGTDHLS